MKTLSLVIEREGLQLGISEEVWSSQKIVYEVIKNFFIMGWSRDSKKGGLSEEERRKFWKIQDAFEKAVAENLDAMELEDDWFGFIMQAKRESKIVEPTLLVRRVEALLDEVKMR